MPKKGSKRLTQRKGISAKGQSTRPDKKKVAAPPPLLPVQLPKDTASISADPEPFTSAKDLLPSRKVTILQNVVIKPPQKKLMTNVAKGKSRICYCSTEVSPDSEDEENEHMEVIHFSVTQHILGQVVNDGLPQETLVRENESLIQKMLRLYPCPKDISESGPSHAEKESVLGITAPANLLKRRHSSDSEDAGSPVVITVQAMVHNVADAVSNGEPVAVHSAIPMDIVRAAPIDPVRSQQRDAIEIDGVVPLEGTYSQPQLNISMMEAIHTAIADMEIDEAINHAQRATTREDIELEINRLRNAGNHLPTYLMASERATRRRESYLGPLNQMCRFCSALYFSVEMTTRKEYTKCCHKGNVVLEPLPAMPDLLRQLFRGVHPSSNHFKRYVLMFNHAFQFVSLEANLRDLPPGRAPPVYAIRGKMYHHISDVNVNAPVQRFGPVYFLDPEVAANQRYDNNNGILDRQLILQIEDLLRASNPYARAYMHLCDRYNFELQTIERLRREAAADPANPPPPLEMPTVTLELLSVRGANRRQYDLPVVEEVAAVYSIRVDAPATPNMRIYVRDQPTRFQNVSEENELLDPLVFPLLFPRGEPGWHIGIPHRNDARHVTPCQFYAYRLAIRDNEQRFVYGGRLSQQFAVASYIKVENNRLKYILYNQDRLRANEYVGLADYLYRAARNNENNDDENEAARIGRMVILPSTFVGSPRFQQQLFQDAMAVVGRFGTPSIFLTMTTNTHWREIVQNIPEGHYANDHPSLTDRVFQGKVEELMKEMLKQHIFGVPVANLYVVEFQKRGLPHCHDLLILRNEDRMTDIVRIDAMISAEIPDPQTEPDLYRIVTTNMIHGPCGIHNPNSVCMVEGECSKKYPKAFREQTTVSENGQVQYKRPDNGRTITVRANNRDCVLDNRWVVPYNPYILLKYNAHINVECCSSVHCVKYLYKYFFKGPDMALLRIHAEEYNEVESFLSGRYMSPPEACWHLNQFPMHQNSHTVYRLCVHLPNRQVVRFQPGLEIEAMRRNEVTQLTGWFLLNQDDAEAREHLYIEIPYHYTWVQNARRWRRRQRGADRIVVRMYTVSFRNQELYYLRLLLLHVRGARSYEDVRTVNGVVYATFREACQIRNLLADDSEWRRALAEACERDMPYQLRNMFAFILIFCDVSDAPALWQEFKDSFMEDFLRRGLSPEEGLQRTLQAIQHVLALHGTRLSVYGLPEPADPTPFEEPIDVEAERAQAREMYANLNADQRAAFDAIMAAVRDPNERRRLFLVDAPAGSGKSYLFSTIISMMRGEQLAVMVTAPTGIAASLLKGGRTLHSTFKLPFDINETTTTGVAPPTLEGRRIAATPLLIIDEVSMVTSLVLNIIEAALRDICDDQRPFGNKVVILGGDFRQTLPVVVGGDRCVVVNACVKSSRHWPLFSKHDLSTNMRARENQPFSGWLLDLGNGTLPPLRRTPYGNIVEIPPECYVTSMENLIDFCFDDVDPRVAIGKAILTPTNHTSHGINDKVLDRLPGQSKTYCSADSVDTTDDPAAEVANYTVEFLSTLTPAGMPPHELVLKEGAVVMLLRNLQLNKGLCNGTRLIVRVLGNQYIDAERIDGSGRPTGERVFIPRIDLKTTVDVLPFKLKRRQFPLRLAYSMTIHKSQEQTFERLGIYLEEPVFTHGQLYVAFSRVRNLQDVRVYMRGTSQQGKLLPDSDNVYTRNVVYREVL